MTDTVLDLFVDRRRAIVTGGSGGIGLAIAKALGRPRAGGLGLAHQDPVEAAATEVPNSVAVPADVMTIDPGQLVDECEAALGGPIDIVVHAAGFQHREPSVDFPVEQWDRLIRVHLTAPFLISQELGRRQLAAGRPASHIFIGSLNNWQSVVPNIPAYAAAKSGSAGRCGRSARSGRTAGFAATGWRRVGCAPS